MDRQKIAVIHATQVSMAPMADAFARGWSDAQVVNILDDGLSQDRRGEQTLTAALTERICRLAEYAHDCGAEAILYSCSAFGSAIELAAARLPIPVLRPNDAMFRAALAHGDDLVLLVTFEPSGPAMAEEFDELVADEESAAKLTTIYVPGALDALEKNDPDTHNTLIAQAAANATNASAIMLGQFSMASAAAACAAATNTPVLTSPDAAVEQLRALLSEA